MKDKREPVRITLRIPAELHDLLAVAIEKSGNSLNAEIVSRLRGSLTIDLPKEFTISEQILRKILKEELDKKI